MNESKQDNLRSTFERLQEKIRQTISLLREKHPRMLAGVGVLLFLLILLLIWRPWRASSPTISLHYDDTWQDVGKIGQRVFFRTDDHLVAYDAKGQRWSVTVPADAQITYGENIYVLQPDTTLRVLRPEDGSEQAVFTDTGYQSLSLAEGSFRMDPLLYARKEDRFLLLSPEGTLTSVQGAVGMPEALLPMSEGMAWTEAGKVADVAQEGTLELDPDIPPLTEPAASPERGVLKWDAASSSFAAGAQAPFTGLQRTGASSLIATDAQHLYFLQDGVLQHTADLTLPWAVDAGEGGIWVVEGRSLRHFDPDGTLRNTLSLDFDAAAVVVAPDVVMAIGKTRRLEYRNGQTQSVDTAEFIRVLDDASGTSSLIYRDEIVPVE